MQTDLRSVQQLTPELKISVNEKYTKEITKADIDRIFEDTVIVHILNGLEKELCMVGYYDLKKKTIAWVTILKKNS